MNGVLLICYVTYRNLGRLWSLLAATTNMIMLQVESNGQKHQDWCATDRHSHRKAERSKGPRLQEREDQALAHHWDLQPD